MAARFETGRRGVLGAAVALAAAGLAVARRGEAAAEAPAVRGRLKQSVSRWCFGKMTLDELCNHAAQIGYKGIDLLEPKDWPVVWMRSLELKAKIKAWPAERNSGL
jgi:hydroxypyruvate isomerase